MKRDWFFSILILIGLGVPAVSIQTNQTEKPVPDVLERQVTMSDLESLGSRDAFMHSLIKTRIPGGTVRIQDCGDKPDVQMAQL
jgi:hypothetical protein